MVFFLWSHLANVTPVIYDFINASKPLFVEEGFEDSLEKYHN